MSHAGVAAATLVWEVDAERVRFISIRFWVIEQDVAPCYVHFDGQDELELPPIEAPGLAADRDGRNIRVNPGKVLALTEMDFLAA